MITTAAFTGQGQLADEDKDIFVSSNFVPSEGNLVGTSALARRLRSCIYLDDNPGYCFAKKDVFAKGQILQANRWVASMLPYLERALHML